ncbi:hypothetical protein GQ53DRAFT_740526 [Thozetella sp. PMI_491]|nr:hypothetical protein GQ53DRAFT_740526 [Thozetella sp. PMI_491]
MNPSATAAAASASASAPASGSALGEPSNGRPAVGKTRSSCDRCHTQKLRCVKQKGSSVCQRCLNLKTTCRFSPRAPRSYLRNRQQEADSGLDGGNARRPLPELLAKPSANSDLISNDFSNSIWPFDPGEMLDAPYEQATGLYPGLCSPLQSESIGMKSAMWPNIFGELHGLNLLDLNTSDGLDLASLNDIGTSSLSPVGVSDCGGELQARETNNATGASSASLVRRLAALSVRIYECTTSFLVEDQTNVNAAGVPHHGAGEPQKPIYIDFDELFRLTTEFIDILKSLSAAKLDETSNFFSEASEHTASHTLQSLVSYDEQAIQPLASMSYTPQTRPFSQIDEATMLMIASCNSRLVDAYMSIFNRVQACIEHSRVPQFAGSWVVVLPKLQVGPVALPPVQVGDKMPISSRAQSFMYIIMVTTLASQLWEQLADVMKDGGAGPTRSSSAAMSSPGSPSLKAIRDIIMSKTDGLMQNMELIKALVGRWSGDEPS